MRYNQLGNTGMFVSELCLGTMTFGAAGENAQWGLIASLDQKGVNEIVARSLGAGVNFFDTADVYSFGESERLLGQSLRDLGVDRQKVVIATKVHGAMGDGPNQRGSSRGHIMDSVDASLERLQLDHIDLYQLHGTDTVTPIDETLRALDDLVASGKVRYVGVSNWQAWRIATALGVSARLNLERFTTLQAYYSVAGRDLERELRPLLEAEKMGLLVWSPLAGGLLSGKFSRENQSPEGSRRSSFDFPIVDKERAWNVIDVLKPIAEAHGCSPARIALAWLLSKLVVTSIIVGAKRLSQLEDNIAAVDITLTEDESAKLDAVSELPPEYPGWMLATQGADRMGAVDLWADKTSQTS